MKQKRDYDTFIAELKKDREMLHQLLEENKKAENRIRQGAKENLDYAALAYTLHNVYCLMENYFLRIAKFFENNLDPISWHKDLIRRMSLEIPGIRPAFFNDSIADIIDELRAFRHVFRNLYQTKLKPKRVMQVQEGLHNAIEGFDTAHTGFIQQMRRIRDGIDE